MMFRERRGKFQTVVTCVRTVYDKTKKRGTQVVVASFAPDVTDLPADVAAQLTPDEQAEAAAWIADRRAQREAQVAPTLPNQIVELADRLTTALRDPAMHEAVLEGIDHLAVYRSIDQLAKALRHHGRTRPPRKKAADPAAAATPVSAQA